MKKRHNQDISLRSVLEDIQANPEILKRSILASGGDRPVSLDNYKIAGQSGVGADIAKENEIVQGSPAFNIGDYKRSYVMFRKLPDLEKKVQDLQKAMREQNPSS